MEEQSYTSVPEPKLPIKKEMSRALGAFSPLERLAFLGAMVLGLVAVLSLLYKINEHFLVSIPGQGGTLSEGVIGTPRFVNPLLASTDADRDLSELVYRGLMQKNAAGEIVPDLAATYTVSNDGLTYTFTLGDAVFHDGEAVTADDVLFTIKSAQDPTLKSALRVSWEGVIVKTDGDKTVTFTLKQPYAPFLESTTLGILPKHIWGKIAYENWVYSDFNTKSAIGEGAYKIKSVSQNSAGIPDYYELVAAREKNGPQALIDTIRMHFYASEDSLIAAYEAGAIDTLGGIDPENAERLAEEGAQIKVAPLPRVFGLFFNPAQAKIFSDIQVRKAIALAIDKDAIVKDVLHGYGQADNGPIPEDSKLINSTDEIVSSPANVDAARKLLEKNGWKLGADDIYTKQISKKETARLSFEIATNDTPELTHAVNLIAADLKKVGIEASPKVYETGSLNQDIIRPRKFQALFFGEVVSTPSDLYAFWHSSQRNDPGLNISGYANSKVDGYLQQGLSTLDAGKRNSVYGNFEDEINSDVPAVFVYSPSYIYVVREGLRGISIGSVNKPSDRFAGIASWYLDTDRVWKIFAKKSQQE